MHKLQYLTPYSVQDDTEFLDILKDIEQNGENIGHKNVNAGFDTEDNGVITAGDKVIGSFYLSDENYMADRSFTVHWNFK